LLSTCDLILSSIGIKIIWQFAEFIRKYRLG
jgi:hypothetical protein